MEFSLNEVGVFIRDVGTPVAMLLGLLYSAYRGGKWIGPHISSMFDDHREFLKSQTEANAQCLSHHQMHAASLDKTTSAIERMVATQEKQQELLESSKTLLELMRADRKQAPRRK